MYTRMLLKQASSGSATGMTTGWPLAVRGTGTARLRGGGWGEGCKKRGWMIGEKGRGRGMEEEKVEAEG